MNSFIPDPLHPAIVHFPIALLSLSIVLAILAVVIYRKPLLLMAFALAVLGTGGAYFAMKAGEEAAGPFLEKHPEAAPTLDVHASWGELTWKVAAIFAFFCLLTGILSTRPGRVTNIFLAINVVVAFGLLYFIYNTAHTGGYMVYHHAVKIAPELKIAKPPFVK